MAVAIPSHVIAGYGYASSNGSLGIMPIVAKLECIFLTNSGGCVHADM